MKILLDSCVWGGAKATLVQSGHDVVWMGDAGSDPGDHQILKIAHDEARLLVTLDKDFGELVFLRGLDHHSILRLVEVPSREQGVVIHAIISNFTDQINAHSIITYRKGRLRIRRGLKT